jgi:hypothetical protein
MIGPSEHPPHVKRVALGKTMRAAPHHDLHVCLCCSSDLVNPVEWEESGPESWSVVLHCPNCDICRKVTASQELVDAFDVELDRGAETLARDYELLMRANMAEEITRFVGAFNADAILPEDFVRSQ